MQWAHSANQFGQRQSLTEHLQNVANLAAEAASAFGAQSTARYLGLWHDLGKFSPAFQDYLLWAESHPGRRRRVDHKLAGAELARAHGGILAYIVHGHHGGLTDQPTLRGFLQEFPDSSDAREAIVRARVAVPGLEPDGRIPLPAHVASEPLSAEMYLRFLYSTLVDADFLDTEAHVDASKAEIRATDTSLEDLWRRFERHHAEMTAGAEGSTVNTVRGEVYEACVAAAELSPGLFRLTVPTGGGKTLSAMAFALRHAIAHGLRRVVVAVPYLTITEQTADVYREVFGRDTAGRPLVLEHHSGVDPAPDDEEDATLAQIWSRLAAENWDAPIVVTTTVQLFESLFAAKPSQARKVHRLARSVIILDEAQSLPTHLLEPILDALGEICRHYHTSVVLSTATQPAFEALPPFATVPAREIVGESARHFALLRRVAFDWRTETPMSWQEIAELMRAEPQALAVVNTKKDASALLDALSDPEAVHLSTSLCGAHRRRVIQAVRQRLATGAPCHVVSTQLIEAGVDLDFPCVLRALGPLDGIIQAAGRCNREGRLEAGRVVVVRPAEGGVPRGAYATATGQTAALLGLGPLDVDDPDTARRYFRLLYPLLATDREDIQAHRRAFDFPSVARHFKMIDDDTRGVVVFFGSEKERAQVHGYLDDLRERRGNPRVVMRRLQPYLVNLYRHAWEEYRRQGLIGTVIEDGLGVWLGKYDPVLGLVDQDVPADDMIC